MTILIENLPSEVDEDEVRSLMQHYGQVAAVSILRGDPSCRHHSCFVSMGEYDKLAHDLVADRVDGLYWKGEQLSAHNLLFG